MWVRNSGVTKLGLCFKFPCETVISVLRAEVSSESLNGKGSTSKLTNLVFLSLPAPDTMLCTYKWYLLRTDGASNFYKWKYMDGWLRTKPLSRA